ncbi:Protein ImuB [Pseudooceanicola algae]|uniref:Protein ImuB n=2 Tax=Pseudooceanicola algae TaxID=1537215 RepID=A0A418SGH5_9RHOB|nr:Protein ImuB [Pseudooceanicola algae]
MGAAQDLPLAVVEQRGNLQIISSLSAAAEARGLRLGMPLPDALAMYPDLVTRSRHVPAETNQLAVLGRWAGRFSPWVGESGGDGLMLDITGCAHLFGGEVALLEQVEADCARLGITLRAAIADTPGAAWAMSRYAGRDGAALRPEGHGGDAVDIEARATRSRAARKRQWERGGARPPTAPPPEAAQRIQPAGHGYDVLAPLPLAALRIGPDLVEALSRVGLRRIGDLIGQPRAPLARRFGQPLIRRLDQALGHVHEPVSPERHRPAFSVRLTLPDPIGLEADLLAGIDRMLPRLCDMLRSSGKVPRLIRLEAWRSDGSMQWVAAGLARPAAEPDRIRPLLAMKLAEIEAGFGIDMLRLVAAQIEDPSRAAPPGHPGLTGADGGGNGPALRDPFLAREDLMARLGARLGMEAITRQHPVASHIPEKTAQTLAAAWSEAAPEWTGPGKLRPLRLFRPEMVTPLGPQPDFPRAPPARFRWRGRVLQACGAGERERIAPEWWLEDPLWRSGTRDYWLVLTVSAERLWLFYAHGGAVSGGWFCQGRFA